MPGRARHGLLGRSGRHDAHPQLLRAQRDINVHVVDPGVREDPHRVARVERVALHDRVPVPFGALEKQELVNPHLAGDAREERERKLDHRMKPDEPADARVHLLDGNRRVTAAERVDPSLSGDRVGHELSRTTDRGKLGCFDVVHHGARVREPGLCKHWNWAMVMCVSFRRSAEGGVRSPASW